VDRITNFDNTHRYICEEYKCQKNIRNTQGKISSKLCAQRAIYEFSINDTEVEESFFRRKLATREASNRKAKHIIKILKKEVDKKAKYRMEPCQYHYLFEYDVYQPGGFDESEEND
jgi:hypothetical protein